MLDVVGGGSQFVSCGSFSWNITRFPCKQRNGHTVTEKVCKHKKRGKLLDHLPADSMPHRGILHISLQLHSLVGKKIVKCTAIAS